ncbi:unnamed protein product [Prunus brigantina]
MAPPDKEDRTCGEGEPITFGEFDVAVVPYFMGSDCIDGFLQWIANVEEIFDSIAIPEEKMVKIVVSHLEDNVASWWDQLRHSRKQQDVIIHKMEEESQEKQDIEPIETPIVVETYISKDEEQRLACSEIRVGFIREG